MNSEKSSLSTGESTASSREILRAVYEAMSEKGYNPISQLVGYILSGDPTYVTGHKNARALICKVERDELLEALMRDYLQKS